MITTTTPTGKGHGIAACTGSVTGEGFGGVQIGRDAFARIGPIVGVDLDDDVINSTLTGRAAGVTAALARD